MKRIVIIGNGISGTTVARQVRKLSDHKITIISSETDYFFSRTALMYIYMGHMKYEHTKPYEDWFWQKNKLELLNGHVQKVIFDKKELVLEDGNTLGYDILVLATGSKSNKFGWPGQDLNGVQGLYSFQDLETMEKYTKGIHRAVVVGGGLIGVEMVEMLQSRNIPVTFLVREESFWDVVLPKEESDVITRHIREHHVDLRLSTSLKEILSDADGRARAVVTDAEEIIDCQFVGLTAGVHPNIGFLKDSQIETDRGILVDKFLNTNIEDVYALGDCAQFKEPLPNRRPIEQVWYTGRMMGEALANTICGKPTAYNPGIWFNSAKFFDIEYQTYGHVWNKLKENESQFYWEHKDGKKCIKFIYNTQNESLLGINTLGIRLRHHVFDRWIKQKESIRYVIENLKEAYFDPEFFPRYGRQIIELYNEQYPEQQIVLKKKGLLNKLLN